MSAQSRIAKSGIKIYIAFWVLLCTWKIFIQEKSRNDYACGLLGES
jgi:hypothetical protein